jgi:hypothetical protein
LPDATPEVKQANLAKASQVVFDLEARREELQMQIDGASPEKLQANLDQNRDTWSPELIATVEAEIAALQTTPADPKAVAALERQATNLDQQIAKSREVLNTFSQDSQPKDLDVEVETEQANSADPAVSRTAADRVINLSMTIPERLKASVATQLADNPSNALTAPQRDYLRAFSEARVAENQLKTLTDVSKEIFFGSAKDKQGIKYIGLAQYRTNVGTALSSGNQKSADRELGLLTNFETSHQAKAKAASEAYAAVLKDGIERRVIRNKDGSWSVEQGLWKSASARADNGGLNIKEDSPKIVANTKTEAEAISKTAAE